MEFNWSKFTENDYEKYIRDCEKHNKEYSLENYIGSVYIGDIGIDLLSYRDNALDILAYDFYVANEDTGYGYKNDILPYDYADGGEIKTPYGLTYTELKNKLEKLFVDYIENHKGSYSLLEHANRPLEIW